jgi:hypothetical protein
MLGIIAQASDFPKLALQNCKSDIQTPRKGVCDSDLIKVSEALKILQKFEPYREYILGGDRF